MTFSQLVFDCSLVVSSFFETPIFPSVTVDHRIAAQSSQGCSKMWISISPANTCVCLLWWQQAYPMTWLHQTEVLRYFSWNYQLNSHNICTWRKDSRGSGCSRWSPLVRLGSLAAGLCGESATFSCQLKKKPHKKHKNCKISKKWCVQMWNRLFRRLISQQVVTVTKHDVWMYSFRY